MSNAYKLLTPEVVADLTGSAVADGPLSINALVRFLYRVASNHPNHPSHQSISDALSFLAAAQTEKP